MSVLWGKADRGARISPAQADGTALILANDVERVLADIDADYGGAVSSFLSHGVLSLSSVVPASIRLQGGSRDGSFLERTSRSADLLCRHGILCVALG